MSNIERLMNKARLACAAILGLAAIAMLLSPASRFWPGGLTGLTVGYVNLEILFRKLGKTDAQGSVPRMMRTGSGLRFSTAALGIIAVMQYDFSVPAYAIGLLTPQLIITVFWAFQDYEGRKG